MRYYPSKVIKGGKVTLECTVDNPGIPDKLTYVWRRGPHVMADATNSVYNISSATLETRSNFTCTVKNEGGESVPATVFINVNGEMG